MHYNAGSLFLKSSNVKKSTKRYSLHYLLHQYLLKKPHIHLFKQNLVKWFFSSLRISSAIFWDFVYVALCVSYMRRVATTRNAWNGFLMRKGGAAF